MKILLISDLSKNQINGVLTTLENTTKILKLWGYEVDHINSDMFIGIPCPGYKEIKLSFVTPTIVGKKILKSKPDYIHIATEGPIGLAARRFLKKSGMKWTSSFHTKFAEFVEAKIGFGANAIWKLLKWVYRNDHFILTTTNSMKNELVDYGFNFDKIGTWSRGVDIEIFEPDNQGPVDRIFLNVGRVSVEKNLEEFYKLDLPGRKVQVGDGPELELYKKKYPNVEFVGSKTGKELAKFYQQSSVMVFPSLKDTFGVVIIESMRSGTPVAAYPVTGPIDIIQPGLTGYMNNDLSQAVNDCLAIPRSLVIEHSQEYTWESATTSFINSLIPCY